MLALALALALAPTHADAVTVTVKGEKRTGMTNSLVLVMCTEPCLRTRRVRCFTCLGRTRKSASQQHRSILHSAPPTLLHVPVLAWNRAALRLCSAINVV